MPDIQTTLGRTLLKSMISTREQKGEISLEDVGSIFMQMASSLNPAADPADKFLHQEIKRLASYITDAKKEIFAIQTNDRSEAVIIDASAHLDEVIKSTEEATNTIMDAADAIQSAASGVGGDKEKQIMDAAVRIYDACTFQDITGQRINKVIRLLGNIEERIAKLNDLFGSEPEFAAEGQESVVPANDKDLLNGPQLASKASSQDDIDALFASLSAKK
jgi:chemotaxis protein CheZ